MMNNRTSNQKRHRLAAAVLIVMLLVVVVGVSLVASLIEIDEDGAHVIDKYGVMTEEELAAQSLTQSDDTQQEAVETPTTEEQAETPTRAVVMSTSALCDEDILEELLELAAEGKYDTIIIDLKDEDGNLAIAVETDEVDTESLTDSSSDTMLETIAALREAGVHVAGRIHCLRDNTTAKRETELAIQYEDGGTWTDYDGTRWLDPTNSDAINYLCDIAKSAVSAGCDELILAELTFPPRGHLDRAEFSYEPDDQASVLLTALQSIQSAAGDVPVSLSADTPSDLLELSQTGAEDGIETGDIGAYLRQAYRVYLWAEDSDEAQELIASTQALAPEQTVIPIFGGGSTWAGYEGSAVLYGRRNYSAALETLEGV